MPLELLRPTVLHLLRAPVQAMEFNSAWSQNMTEFERQAQDIELQVKSRQAEEFAAFQEQLHKQTNYSYKFSRELLQMRKSIDALARQGQYAARPARPVRAGRPATRLSRDGLAVCAATTRRTRSSRRRSSSSGGSA